MRNKWVAYDIAKQHLKDRLYKTCKTDAEWQRKYAEGIKQIINLLKL